MSIAVAPRQVAEGWAAARNARARSPFSSRQPHRQEVRVSVSRSEQLGMLVCWFCYPLKLANELLGFSYKYGTVC